MRPKVLFICKTRLDHYGNPIGLINSLQFIANFLLSKKIEAKLVSVIDANCIDKEVSEYKPTHVLIGAIWVTPEKLSELMALHKKVLWKVQIHSKTPFLAMEGTAIDYIKKYSKLRNHNGSFPLAANSKELVGSLEKSLNIRLTYLPNIYYPCHTSNEVPVPHWHNVVSIGCFGAIRPLKNHLIQAMAAISFANKIKKTLHFHINADRTEQAGNQVLKNLRALFHGEQHLLIEHSWHTHASFLQLIKFMDLGMQVSLSESFNVVTADFIESNVPIVVSNDIEWMPQITQANPNSLESIEDRLHYIYSNRCEIIDKSVRKLGRHNRDAGNLWLKWLS